MPCADAECTVASRASINGAKNPQRRESSEERVLEKPLPSMNVELSVGMGAGEQASAPPPRRATVTAACGNPKRGEARASAVSLQDVHFPPPRMSIEAEITPDLLLRAYAAGVFPMAERRESRSLLWISPEARGILPLDRFHVPKRLARTVRGDRFEVRTDTAFAEVMRACAAPAPGREESWINDEIVSLYCELHRRGHAHSVECWRDDRRWSAGSMA